MKKLPAEVHSAGPAITGIPVAFEAN